MPKFVVVFLSLLLSLFIQPTWAKKKNLTADDILGDWVIIDEVYGSQRAIGRVSKMKNGKYVMRIVENNLKMQEARTHCYKCPKPFTGKRIMNIPIMWNMVSDKKKPYKYNGGYGLDPYQGVMFKGTVELKNKNTMRIRATPLEVSFVGKHYIFIRKKKK